MNARVQSDSEKILCECNEQRDEAKRNRAERSERPMGKSYVSATNSEMKRSGIELSVREFVCCTEKGDNNGTTWH